MKQDPPVQCPNCGAQCGCFLTPSVDGVLASLALERQRKRIVAFLSLRGKEPTSREERAQFADDLLGMIADGSYLAHLDDVPEAEAQAAYERAVKVANVERAAVVAFLRRRGCSSEAGALLDENADAIERGEHVK